MTNTAFVGLDYIFDITHPDGKVACYAKSLARITRLRDLAGL